MGGKKNTTYIDELVDARDDREKARDEFEATLLHADWLELSGEMGIKRQGRGNMVGPRFLQQINGTNERA